MPGKHEFTGNMQSIEQERIFSGSLTCSVKAVAPSAKEGYLEVVIISVEQGGMQQTGVVTFAWRYRSLIERIPNIVNMFLVVTTQQSTLGSGRGVVHDFSADTHEIVEDGVLNRKALIMRYQGRMRNWRTSVCSVWWDSAYENKYGCISRSQVEKDVSEKVWTLIRSGSSRAYWWSGGKYRFIQDDSKSVKLKKYL